MITRLKISRFKGLRFAEIELGGNVVFIGPNNSGKSTALQALTLWDAGSRRWAEKWEKTDTEGNFVKRPKVKSGVTINRRDLHAIPVPTARLLWNDLHTHDTAGTGKEKKTMNVLMQVEVEGVSATGTWNCGIEFYYANEESFYCRLMGGADQHLPQEVFQHPVVFLPPMSGLADREFRKEPGEIRMLTGQGQTAQVLRNLCWQLYSRENKDPWNRLVAHIQEHFSVILMPPLYDPVNSSLSLSYKDQHGTELDISCSGRGCQQLTLLLCFLLQHPGAILLLDEPDAHLEILRQRDIYTLLTEIAAEQHSQIIAASHSSTVMQVAGERDVLVAFLGSSPHRVDTRARQNQVKKALESIPLSDFYLAQQAGWMLYLEGTTDLAILRKLAIRKGHEAAAILAQRVPLICLGSNKPGDARSHYEAMREAMPRIPGLAIFDRLPNPETQLSTMQGLREEMWQRREIENYLVSRESILEYATSGFDVDDLFTAAERERRIKIMTECIGELEQALAVTRKPSPWSADLKVTDDFLDPLFENYYQQIGTPQLTYKRDYHGLAETIPIEQLDPEIDAMLDAVVATAGTAAPA
ncbi:MAG: AAA family ATPase [Akkermansiaceae bacterium]|nr:AAA family ATPase [Akkermansiaceae bacterium]MCF7733573.1 AAA family ATPase [Akkermansiaceae bacterium]